MEIGSPLHRVALLGHGAIAAYVGRYLARHECLVLDAVVCRRGREDRAKADLAAPGQPSLALVTDARDIDPARIALAVDCTGHEGLMEHGPTLLAAGVDVLSISTGVLSDPEAIGRLENAALQGASRLRFAVGAIGGIDALISAAAGRLDRVAYTGRKPPAGWKGTPAEDALDLARLEAPAQHFHGSARAAAANYPRNANVAAMVALAGVGLDATEVTLIADPALERNCHTVEASGDFGSFRMELFGAALPDNPKSSALAAMSLVRAIESALIDAPAAPVAVIGAARRLTGT